MKPSAFKHMYKVYQIRALTLVLNTVYFDEVTVSPLLVKDANAGQ